MRGRCSFVDFWTCELKQFCEKNKQKQNGMPLSKCNSNECLPFGMQNNYSSCFTLWWASSLVRLVWPCANASFLIKHESVRTCDHVEHAIDAIEELIAHIFIFVPEIPILAWTVQWWLRFLWKKSNFTAFIECKSHVFFSFNLIWGIPAVALTMCACNFNTLNFRLAWPVVSVLVGLMF